MRIVELQYADNTPDSKILDDLTTLSRSGGMAGHRPVAYIDEPALLANLRERLTTRRIPLAEESGYPEPEVDPPAG